MSDDTFKTLPYELQNTIESWAIISIRMLQISIVKRGLSTSNLYRSFRYDIKYGSDGMPTKVTIGFLYHGKFVDMGVGNGQKMESIKGNREIWSNLPRADKKGKKRRVPKKWYSPTMYHEYQRAAEILAGKYGMEIPARFEKILSERIENK
jgi:hypothetical protein